MQLNSSSINRLGALALAMALFSTGCASDDSGGSGTGGVGGTAGGGVGGGGVGGTAGGGTGGTGGGGAGGVGGGAPAGEPTFDAIFTDIITKGSAGNCTFGACHGGPPSVANGMLQLYADNKDMTYAALVGVASSTMSVCGSMTYVVAGQPDQSLFYTKLLETPTCGVRMPAGYPPLSAGQIEQIRMWIANGAMNDGGMPTAGAGGMGGAGGAAGTMGGMGGEAGGGTGGDAGGGAGGMGGGTFTLTSTAFTDGGMLPATNRCVSLFGAGGPSPALMWSGAPAGTMSFALTVTDNSNDFAHWTIYDIPASVMSLPENVMVAGMPSMPAGAKQGANTAPLAGPGYFGPCGGTSNPYEFTLYAIDAATLGVAADADRAAVQAAIDMHELGSVSIVAMSGP